MQKKQYSNIFCKVFLKIKGAYEKHRFMKKVNYLLHIVDTYFILSKVTWWKFGAVDQKKK